MKDMVEKQLTSLNKEFWKNFLLRNKNFKNPCVFENVLNEDLLKNLNLGVLEGLKNRLRLENVYDGFRVYLNKEEQPNKYLKEFCKTPPNQGESIVEYSERVFDEKFCIIMNSGEKYSDLISKYVLKEMEPLLELMGLPACGIEVTIFIGNYGWTPLGIHQDHRGENVMHFHLGPGKKTMYTWDEEKYKTLAASEANNQNIKPLLKHATSHVFKTGDLFFMPWNKHHVGNSDELSVGVSLWFNNPTNRKYSARILGSLFNQYVDKDNDNILKPQKEYLVNSSTLKSFMNGIKLENDQLELSVSDFFKQLYDEYKISLLSNGGWQSVPLSLAYSEQYNVDNYKDLLDKKIKGSEPFTTYYIIKKDTLQLYVRGTKIELKYHPKFITIIDKLNSHETFSVKELLSDISKEWPLEAGLYSLSLIYDKRGLQIV